MRFLQVLLRVQSCLPETADLHPHHFYSGGKGLLPRGPVHRVSGTHQPRGQPQVDSSEILVTRTDAELSPKATRNPSGAAIFRAAPSVRSRPGGDECIDSIPERGGQGKPLPLPCFKELFHYNIAYQMISYVIDLDFNIFPGWSRG